MTDSRLFPTHLTRPPAWTRDHVLGCILFGVAVIEAEGQPRVASEIRHLAMLWYTGARRASPGGRPAMPQRAGDLPPRQRRRSRSGLPDPDTGPEGPDPAGNGGGH